MENRVINLDNMMADEINIENELVRRTLPIWQSLRKIILYNPNNELCDDTGKTNYNTPTDFQLTVMVFNEELLFCYSS